MVDLDYSHELHDLHNNFPLASEKIQLKKEMLSEYQLEVIEDNIFSIDKNKKVFPIYTIKEMQTSL